MQLIDKYRIYTQGAYSFQNFVTLDDSVLIDILSWRNHDDIRKWMYNPQKIAKDDHFAFVQGLHKREDVYYWLISQNNTPVGVANITHVSYEMQDAEIGYYLRPDRSILALNVLYDLCDFYFHSIDLQTLQACTMVDNHAALLINIFLGFHYKCSFDKQCGEQNANFWHLEMKRDEFDRTKDRKRDLRCYLNFLKTYYKDGKISCDLKQY